MVTEISKQILLKCCISHLHTALTVRFSSSNFTASESSGSIPVTLLLEGGTSSSDISVTMVPSDQSPVSAQGESPVFY